MYASRRLTPYSLVTLGYAQYFMQGEFSSIVENVNFASAKCSPAPNCAGRRTLDARHRARLRLLRLRHLAHRHTGARFYGTLFILEQRIKL